MSAVRVLPLTTPTLPPATTTNCYRVGDTVVDPASPYPDEQARLAAWLGGGVRRILLTHHHRDHVGGVADLVRRTGARVYAHTDARVDFPVDGRLVDGDEIDTGDGVLVAAHTPGHADGHLVFSLVGSEDVIVGDLLAGEGTIVLVPPEGHLRTYLASLERLRGLGTVFHPAHGPVVGLETLDLYVRHRLFRTTQFERVLRERGGATAEQIAEAVYREVPGADLELAALQVGAHLRWLEEEGRGADAGGTFRLLERGDA